MTADTALGGAQSAAKFHLETFGDDVLAGDAEPVNASVVEASVDG